MTTTTEGTEELSHTFELCKKQLRTATTLGHLSPPTKLALMVDTSDKALGSVLQQHFNGHWHPLDSFRESNTNAGKLFHLVLAAHFFI
ncbi:hypothetical protein CDAR_270661 [Caerostris darwini]|uniref:Reverse transcriptase/retrotransposon-derived protein RNase H-like domain-containing protein n=1 Tax=Caerostris darwini TaxID=1538125 RepID=A0AAV4TB87_9ARAC|nr:hypothetical protein CDAR_270661 [Caerostris darwini]